MKKTSAQVILFVLLISLICAVYAETQEMALQSVYAQINMSDTQGTLTEKFGEGTPKDGLILFGDVLCVFFESGRLRAKSLSYDDIHAVAQPTGGDLSSVRALKQGTFEDELTMLLGSGREILCMNLSDEEDAGLRKLLAWKNEKGTVLEALLELDDGKWILFAIGEIP